MSALCKNNPIKVNRDTLKFAKETYVPDLV